MSESDLTVAETGLRQIKNGKMTLDWGDWMGRNTKRNVIKKGQAGKHWKIKDNEKQLKK